MTQEPTPGSQPEARPGPPLEPKIDRTIRNLVLLGDDLSSGRLEWQSRPTHLEYSTNNICNLRCVMCPQHDGVPVVKAERSFSERILDEILPGATVLQPVALSEPFTGDLDLYIEKCEEHDTFLHLVTNATLFTEEKLRRIMPRLHRMYISIETFDKEVFEELRINAKYDKVVDNIRMAIAMAAEYGVPVALVTIFMRPVHEQLPEFLRQCHALGCRDVVVLELLPTYPRWDEHMIADRIPMERLMEIREEALDVARELGMNVDFNMPPPLGGVYSGSPLQPRVNHAELAHRTKSELVRQFGHFCQHAATYMKVDPDGKVFPCCRAPEELEMGNLNDSSLAEVWNGPAYQDLRRRMQTGDLHDCCKDCAVLVGTPHYRKPGEASPGEHEALGSELGPFPVAGSSSDA